MQEAPLIDSSRIAAELGLTREQVESVTELLDEGNTVPFITRYRKERTGNLDEEQIRRIQERVHVCRQLAERAQTILRLIDGQGKLTPELRAEIEQADSLKRLEDLYLPYRPKRRSRAMQARERGLEPLAEQIWTREGSPGDLEAAAAAYVDANIGVAAVAEALQGAADILAERIGDDAGIREKTRTVAWNTGRLVVSATKTAEETGKEYRDYFDYSEAVSRIPPHRALAINRGEKAGALRIKFDWDEPQAQAAVDHCHQFSSHPQREFLERCAADALQRLIQPSLEREIRRELTENAERHAVSVFARNLKNLLLQPPLQGERILAVDPGFRTGCKVAVLDECGNRLAIDVIYVTGSAEKRAATIQKLVDLVEQHQCTLIAIGNGTACRETEELVSELIAERLPGLKYLIVNEAGASIYSTSTVAREEFPDLDATARGTISIGRRLQDPLSELVKIDPQHIGVGMYQHDVTPKLLKESLDQVIESCVNFVGVDLNTASASLLRHISGLNQLIARRVVEWREQNGRFRNRRQLLEVAGVGDATFTQSAGFLKIQGGDEPLDATWIHPESYEASRKLLARLSLSPEGLLGGSAAHTPMWEQLQSLDLAAVTRELDIGLPTLNDIVEALSRPGRDPRTDLPGPVFKRGILKLDDLHEGMELTGTVLNVVDFGAFVDIGLKDSGLVHVSRMSDRFVRSPHEVVSVGDVVTVWVLGVDHERRRVSLTMVDPAAPPRPETAKPVGKPAAANGENERKRPPATSHSQKPAGQRSRAKKGKSPRPALTEDKTEGRTPLSGFDELKELWRSRQK